MKNYILFSTNEPKAIDNISFAVSVDESMDTKEAIAKLAKECKYSHFQVVPIGEPLSTAYDMDKALFIIKGLKLHRKHRMVDKKAIDIILSSDAFTDISVSTEDGKVILAIKTNYESGNPALVVKEHDVVQRLIELFGHGHLGYHKMRNVFELVPSDTEDIGIDFALVKGDIVQITKKYTYIDVEL